MPERERIIRLWFAMWRKQQDLGMDAVFAEDVVYIESWGPQYQGRQAVKHWFAEWNTRGKVLKWEILQFFHKGSQTVVQWCFQNAMQDGRQEEFDGMSLIKWTPDNKICFLQEFGCNQNRYNPYQQGPTPTFFKQQPKWF